MPIHSGLLQLDKNFGLLTETEINISPDSNNVSCDGYYNLKINVENKIYPNDLINDGYVILKNLTTTIDYDPIPVINGVATLKINFNKLNEINIQAEYQGVHRKTLKSKSKIVKFTIKKKNILDFVDVKIIYPSQPTAILGGKTIFLDYYHCFNSSLTVVASILPKDSSNLSIPSGFATCRIGFPLGTAIKQGIQNFRILESQSAKIDNGYATLKFSAGIGNIDQDKYIQVIYEGDACFQTDFTPTGIDGLKVKFIEKDPTNIYLSLLNKGKVYNLNSISINTSIKSEKLDLPNDGYLQFYAIDTNNSSSKILFDNVKPVNGQANLIIRPGRLYPGSWQIFGRYISNKETNCYDDSIYNYVLINVHRFVKYGG